MDSSQLTTGDVVFFSSTLDISSDAGYEKFPHLAGRVQSLAYPDGLARPWHHVGVMVSPTDIVEFAQIDDGIAGSWDPGLGRHTMTVPADQAVIALRHQAFAPGLAEGSLALVEAGAEYDITSLLGFAAATQARLFSAGSAARRRTMDLALGAVELAPTSIQRPRGTCVSLVLEALDAVITPTEPAGGTRVPGDLPDEVSTPIQRLMERAQGGTDGQALTTGPEPIDEVLDEFTTLEGYGGSGDTPLAQVPGFVGTTRDYLAMIARLVRGTFADTSAAQMIGAGVAWRRRNPGATPAVLVSPAMLFDTLIDNGFRRVRLTG